ncbi:hypothetical protein GCM10009430_33180 [Aquimarina litoralis]|uniref:Uncharacterized protein n=1 Tax=Aquimarina litoralis TaxID=584605 RepID=A0ABP3U9H4_9FLAO
MSNLHIGNVDLTDNENFQFLYGSQLYGTLFGIYGKFTTTEAEEGYYIQEIEFKTINYKGILNINISDLKRPESKDYQPPQDPNADEESPMPTIQKVLVFLIEVQALKTADPDIEYMNFIHQNGGNENGIKVDKNNFLHFDRRLKKIHENGEALKNNVFDSEFYYREGILQDGDQYPEVCPKPKTQSDGPVSLLMSHSGGICPRGTVKIR